MSVMRLTFALILATAVAGFTGRVDAQDEGGLDALLQDITTTPAPTAEAAVAPVADLGAPVTESVPEPVAEAAAEVAAPAAMEAVVEPVVDVAASPTPAESLPAEAPVGESPVSAPEVVAEVAPVAESAPAPESAPDVVAEAAPVPSDDPFAVAESAPVPVTEVGAEPAVDVENVPMADAEPEAAVEGEVPVPAETVEADPEAPLQEGASPDLLSQQEEIRRQARMKDAQKNLALGEADLREGRWDEAVKKLQDAQAKMPVLPSTAGKIEQAKSALGKAHMGKATESFERGDLKNARMSLGLAKAFVPPGTTDDMERKLSRAEERAAVEAARPIPVKKRTEIVEREKSIKELLNEGRQYLEAGDYNAAEELFEKVLIKDEYNIDAMRFLRKLDEKRYAARSKEREATEADMMQRVRDTWNPPVYEESKTPRAIQNRGAVEIKTSAQKLQEKMEQIIIPSIEFRQANINDVVTFLVEASIQGDKVDGAGVNIILNLASPGGGAASAPAAAPVAAADGFGEFGGAADGFGDLGASPEAAADTSGIPTITLNLRRISLLDAIKYITEVARLKYRLEENAVMITPEGVVSGRVITRLYPVQPSIIDVVVERGEEADRGGEFTEMGATRSSIKKSDVKEFFEKTGVPFPQGTSITYNPTISQLIVANTPENLEVFERILSRLNVIPNQVEIEARFVEISQDDLEELGFQWILTDNWEMAQKKNGGGLLGGQQQIVGFADQDGFTKGLRFFNQDSSSGSINPLSAVTGGSGAAPLGGIFSMGGILTNPEVTLVIQALSQHGGTDLLSAPRVTTRSGVNAQIQVVREIIYPTEFETQEAQDNTFNGGGTGGSQVIMATPPLIYPGTFETREVGVILNVTPTVGPDGYTIDLTMVPEVAELVDWIQYGYIQNGVLVANIPQPVFASRNVTTSIVIWDGQTVVMGGLIREDLVKVNDKVPILGDIPLLGRLFRSEGQYSKKKNLLIFVTARLVDPAGKPIHRSEDTPEGDAAAAEEITAKP